MSLTHAKIVTGYCLGNFVGPLVFKEKDAPRYAPGFTVVVICAVVGALLILVYAAVCQWDNRQRDKAGVPEGFDHAYEDDLTDKKVRNSTGAWCYDVLTSVKNPQFRYII